MTMAGTCPRCGRATVWRLRVDVSVIKPCTSPTRRLATGGKACPTDCILKPRDDLAVILAPMPYLYLAIAIVAEVVATSTLKATQGFTKPLASVVVIVGYCVAFYCLSITLRTMSVGIACAIWCGVGMVLVTAVAVVLSSKARRLGDGWYGPHPRRRVGFEPDVQYCDAVKRSLARVKAAWARQNAYPIFPVF